MKILMKKISKFWMLRAGLPLCVLVSFIESGCGTALKVESLRTPNTLTCITVPTAISFKAKYGLLDTIYEIRLERGAYLSEKEDDEGTYFRAPPGGVYSASEASLAQPTIRDGGFFVPHDQNIPPRLYLYFSAANVPALVPSLEEVCSKARYIKDPVSHKVSSVAFGLAGGMGGVLGRSAAPNSSTSYGQAAAGGVGAGLIVATMINADVGKIVPGMPIKDDQFIAKLRQLSKQAITIQVQPTKEN